MLENDYASVEHMTWVVKDMVTNPDSLFSYLYLVIPVLELQILLYNRNLAKKFAVTPPQGTDWHH